MFINERLDSSASSWERRRLVGKELTITTIFVIVALIVAGCGSKSSPKAAHQAPPPPPADPWVLKCNDPFAKEPALLWNGVMGVRVGRDGTFVGSRYEIDSYEKDGEEKIKSLPPLRSVRWKHGNAFLSPETGTDYLQTLDMRTGILHTEWKIGKVKVNVDSAIHAFGPKVDQNWSFENIGQPLTLELGEVKSVRPGETLDASLEESNGRPHWKRLDSGAKILTVNPNSDKRVVCRFQWQDFTGLSMAGLLIDAFSSSKVAWSERWKTDIEIDGPVEDQQAIRSFLFYLRSGMGTADLPISPFGLSDATYNGHVFWDADTWVFPALAFVDPDKARFIADYRLKTFAMRVKNGLADGTSALPARSSKAGSIAANKNAGGRFSADGTSALPARSSKAGSLAANKKAGEPPAVPVNTPKPVFPWESSVTGKEVGPLEMQKEIHINGDVAWMLENAAALGIVDPKKAKAVKQAVANYYLKRATKGANGEWELKNVMSPDEFHTGDNDLYTNLLAEWATGQRFKRPRDNQSYLTYDNDSSKTYKQAAAVLAVYPLQMIDDQEARKMMDRFSDKITKNGPAMSHSVHATIWARLGETEKAYEEWRTSWQRYTKHPLMLFSEKPAKDTTYFTTGAAGCLQTVIYGFLGFRIDYKKENMAAWSMPLNNKWLSIRPRLPAAWKSVKFKNFIIKGKRYNLFIDASGVKVNQGEP